MLDEKRGQDSPAQHETIPSPLERCHLGIEETSAPYNEDLAWIVRQFKERIGASGVAVTIHHFDGRPPAVEVADGQEGPSQRALESWASVNLKQWTAFTGGNWPKTSWRAPTDEFPWHSFTMHMASNDCSRAVISAFFPRLNPEEFQAREFVSLRFQPVLSGYFKLWLLHQATSRRLQTMMGALANVDFGVIALDRDAKIVFENPAASRILDSAKVLQRCRGSLSARGAVESVKLRVAIDQVLSGKRMDDGVACETLVVIGRATPASSPLVAAVTPVGDSGFEGNDSAAIVYIFDPATPNDQTLAPLARWYGLSAAEARLVRMLVAGRSVAEIAGREALKQDTVRTYLKNIFRKTSTKSQTDLVRLMMTSPVRLRLPDNRAKGRF